MLSKKIKYYQFTQNNQMTSGTCYDGTKEFTKPFARRLYPDEYLIADILEKYAFRQQTKLPPNDKKILTLKESWGGKYGRTGAASEAIVHDILATIDDKKIANSNTLVLVPLLLNYHHPGITIDVKNKKVIYLDPYGSEPYQLIQNLIPKLKARQFEFIVVKTQQQERGKDRSSCGPILTASMMQFIDQFLKNGCLRVDQFREPRKNLAAERILQMNLRNPKNIGMESKDTVDEIGLADTSLWNTFLNEQLSNNKSKNDIIEKYRAKTIEMIEKQKAYIMSLPEHWENNPIACKNLKFICQSQIILSNNMLLLKNSINKQLESITSSLDNLLIQNNSIFHKNSLNNSSTKIEKAVVNCPQTLFKPQEKPHKNNLGSTGIPEICLKKELPTSRGLFAGSRNLATSLDLANKPRDVEPWEFQKSHNLSIKQLTGAQLVICLLLLLLMQSVETEHRSNYQFSK